MKLAACIVNYHSADFALACARSLVAEWVRLGFEPSDLDLAVVDNGDRGLGPAWTEQLEQLGALVVHSDRNRGYAGGIELGFSWTRPADYYLILNPDLYFLPGSLGALLEAAAQHPEAGAFAPLTFLDPGCTLALPPVADLTPLESWRQAVGEVSRGAAERAARERTRAALRWWRGGEPFEAPNLSGACLLVPAAARAELGGVLLDERYPLYFEDNDLCRRLAVAGRARIAVPAARVVHHWARSSGVGAQFEAGPRARYLTSRERWFERWYPGLFGRLGLAADQLLAGWPRDQRGVELHAFEELGELADAGHGLEFDLPPGPRSNDTEHWVLELSLTPNFALAGGVLGQGARVELPASCVEWLFPGRVFARALERETLAVLGAWTFVKSCPARVEALGPNDRLEAA